MMRITKNYFHTNDAPTETNYVLTTDETKKFCQMVQLYAMTSEISGQIKEETVRDYESIVPQNKSSLKKRPQFKAVVTIDFITLAQKILSPLTRPIELNGVPKDLIDFVKETANDFKQINFPKWFSDPDKKKVVQLHIVFKDTLESSPYWCCVPFTKLNALSNSRSYIINFINDIFHAVFSKYKSSVVLVSSKTGLTESKHSTELQQFL